MKVKKGEALRAERSHNGAYLLLNLAALRGLSGRVPPGTHHDKQSGLIRRRTKMQHKAPHVRPTYHLLYMYSTHRQNWGWRMRDEPEIGREIEIEGSGVKKS